MKKIIIIGITVVIVIGTGCLVLANLKSPEPSKNLLRYWFFHSNSHTCKIIKQEYNESEKYNYVESCVERLCDLNNPLPSDYHGRINLDSIVCQSKTEKGLYIESLQECVKDHETVEEPKYPVFNGQQEKYYYFGIPILKESCPTGYSE